MVREALVHFFKGLTCESAGPEDLSSQNFQIGAEELRSIVEHKDYDKLIAKGGIEGVASCLLTSISDGISTDELSLHLREKIYGVNKLSTRKGTWFSVWKLTLMILRICAIVYLTIQIIMRGCQEDAANDFVGTVAMILLVFIIMLSDYKPSLQFKVLDETEKSVSVKAIRDGCKQKISQHELVPGDIVELAPGDQVPADGLFVSGSSSLLIDESRLTRNTEAVHVDAARPFLLSGAQVQDGSCKMLVTGVGMRTKWGKLYSMVNDVEVIRMEIQSLLFVSGIISTVFEWVGGVLSEKSQASSSAAVAAQLRVASYLFQVQSILLAMIYVACTEDWELIFGIEFRCACLRLALSVIAMLSAILGLEVKLWISSFTTALSYLQNLVNQWKNLLRKLESIRRESGTAGQG